MQGSPETTENIQRALDGIRKHAQEGNFDRLEEAWIEALQNSQQVSAHLDLLLDTVEPFVGDERKVDRVGTLLELVLPGLGEGTAARPALRLHWLLVRCFPDKREYREGFCERYERLYPVASAERAFYEVCGFPGCADPVQALARLERLLRYREGAYVYHRAGWGVGRVVAVDPFLKQVKVDLEHKQGHRIAIDVVDSILQPLSPDSFLALLHKGVDELKRMSEEDPVGLLNLVLEDFGNPLALKDIKAHLVPDVVPADAWTKWWSRTRDLLREKGLFRVGDRAPHTVERLEKAVSYEDELVQSFLRSDWPRARQIARQIARRTGGEPESAWSRIRERLLQMCQQSDRVVALEAALILDRGDASEGREALRGVFGGLTPQEVVEVLQGLTSADDQRRASESLPELRPADWEGIAADLLLGKKDNLREMALEMLEARALPRAESLLLDLVKSPKTAPEAFCFALATHLGGTAHPALAPFREKGVRELLTLVLDLMDHLQHRGHRHGRIAMKGVLGKVQEILSAQDCRFFREGLSQMDSAEREDIHARLVKNSTITPHLKGNLLDVLLVLEPSFARAAQKQPWEENVIYVTAEGLASRQTEFREIMEVKLPKNFQDIGRAAAFGDLSENAEYTSALEERDRLTKQAAKMKAELDRAKVIAPSMVDKDVVSLGSRIRVRNTSTGEEHDYSILGPWDGTPEDGVLSYLSPLGRLFLGKRVGETLVVDLPGGSETYQLLQTTTHFERPEPGAS